MAESRDEDKVLSAAQNGEQKKLIAEFAPKAEKFDRIAQILNATNAETVSSDKVLGLIKDIVFPSKKG